VHRWLEQFPEIREALTKLDPTPIPREWDLLIEKEGND
jgi:hypothetical protein